MPVVVRILGPLQVEVDGAGGAGARRQASGHARSACSACDDSDVVGCTVRRDLARPTAGGGSTVGPDLRVPVPTDHGRRRLSGRLPVGPPHSERRRVPVRKARRRRGRGRCRCHQPAARGGAGVVARSGAGRVRRPGVGPTAGGPTGKNFAATAEDQWFAAQRASGFGEEIIPRLEAACAAEPLRESRWEQLILALTDAGRPAEALRAYGRIRDTLRDEWGSARHRRCRTCNWRFCRQEPVPGAGRTTASRPRPAASSSPTRRRTVARALHDRSRRPDELRRVSHRRRGARSGPCAAVE